MNSYEIYIQLYPALEYIIEEISIYLANDIRQPQERTLWLADTTQLLTIPE